MRSVQAWNKLYLQDNAKIVNDFIVLLPFYDISTDAKSIPPCELHV